MNQCFLLSLNQRFITSLSKDLIIFFSISQVEEPAKDNCRLAFYQIKLENSNYKDTVFVLLPGFLIRNLTPFLDLESSLFLGLF